MRPILITIAGGTASGKSTVVKEIIKHFSKEEVRVICQDNYYKAQDNLTLEERTKINYDHPNSFDIDLLVDHINKLKNGESINKPIYDFSIHNRTNETDLISPVNVVIIEGILIFAVPEIRELFDIKLLQL